MKCYRTQPQAVSHVRVRFLFLKEEVFYLFFFCYCSHKVNNSFIMDLKVYRSVLLKGRKRAPIGSSGSDGGKGKQV